MTEKQKTPNTEEKNTDTPKKDRLLDVVLYLNGAAYTEDVDQFDRQSDDDEHT